jgi:uncharacterized membrane protein YidH (DUF202 family)
VVSPVTPINTCSTFTFLAVVYILSFAMLAAGHALSWFRCRFCERYSSRKEAFCKSLYSSIIIIVTWHFMVLGLLANNYTIRSVLKFVEMVSFLPNIFIHMMREFRT